MTHSNSYLLCCDWGTSSFRLRLTDRKSGKVYREIESQEGVSTVFDRWRTMNSSDPTERERFYLRVVDHHIDLLSDQSGVELNRVPVVVSGMASSSIGMRELPYAQTPFSLDGSGVVAGRIADDHRPILLVSGLQSQDDVMRGEEVQLIGLDNLIRKLDRPTATYTVILPGTHSKHVTIQGGSVVDFSTAMTGELFDLLTTKGLLSHSVLEPTETTRPQNWGSFRKGVRYSTQRSLLYALFRVRTNNVFKEYTLHENYHFLSGLLIGAELGELVNFPDTQIILCCPAHLTEIYGQAIEELGLKGRTHRVLAEEFSRLTVASQIRIADRLKL